MKPQDTYLSLSILLLFIMLWLPFGQYEFLIDHWMKIGTYAIPFLLIGAFSYFQQPHTNMEQKIRFLSIVMLILYIVHQFEEHWIDLYGNYYSFYTRTNELVLGVLHAENSEIKPLSKEMIFVINTSLVWLVGCIAIIRSPYLFAPLAMAGISFFNGITHTLGAIFTGHYNPGLLTSLLIFIPFYFWFYRYLYLINSKYLKYILLSILWSILAHVLMVGGMLASNWFKLFPESVYFALIIFWSCLPLVLFRNVKITSHSLAE